MATLTPVRSILEQITGQLRAEVLSGDFTEGMSLREVQLAERFGVSRATIRQVFQQLVQEGLLVARRNRGVIVTPPTSPVVGDLLSPLRVKIETYAIRICHSSLTSDDFNRWDQILTRLRVACEGENQAEILESDFAFHRCLIEKAGLDEVLPIWTSIITRIRPHHAESNRGLEDQRVIPIIHERLIEVFRTGTRDDAVEALSQHILNGEFNQQVRREWATKRI